MFAVVMQVRLIAWGINPIFSLDNEMRLIDIEAETHHSFRGFRISRIRMTVPAMP